MKYFLSIVFTTIFYTMMLEFFPVGNGGEAMGVLYSYPFLQVVSLILPWFGKSVSDDSEIKHSKVPRTITKYAFLCFLCIILVPNSKNSPFKVIRDGAYWLRNSEEITYNDIFLEPVQENYIKIILARNKFASDLPEKIFQVKFRPAKETSDTIRITDFTIYQKNSKYFSTSKVMSISTKGQDTIQFNITSGKFNLCFYASSKGFEKFEKDYDGYDKGVSSTGNITLQGLTKKYAGYYMNIQLLQFSLSELPGFYKLLNFVA